MVVVGRKVEDKEDGHWEEVDDKPVDGDQALPAGVVGKGHAKGEKMLSSEVRRRAEGSLLEAEPLKEKLVGVGGGSRNSKGVGGLV